MKHRIKIGLLLMLLDISLSAIAQDKYKEVIDYKFDDAKTFASNGLAAVKKDGKWGYIDQTGKLVIDYQFDETGNFSSNGLAAVRRGDKWGYIDRTGRLIIDYKFDLVNSFSKNGLASVKKGKKWGYIDKTEKLVIDYQFDDAGCFNENDISWVKVSGVFYGYINSKGKNKVNFIYYGAKDFSTNGLASVKKRSKWGFIDQTGKLVIDYLFDETGVFATNNLVRVKKGDSWGFIDKTGKLVIDYQFDETNDFASNDLACVKKGGKWGYIDQTGRFIIDNQFDFGYDFASNGLASIRKEDKYGYIVQSNITTDITTYIKSEIAKWQEKGKYETTDAYKARLTEVNRNQKLQELSTIAVQDIAPKYCNWNVVTTEYDADNQTFMVCVKGLTPFYVKVPIIEAESFDKSISKLQFSNVQYALGTDSKFFIQKATIANPSNDKTYIFSSLDNAVFAYNQYNINFEPMQINLQTSENKSMINNDSKSVTVGLSEVDINIPTNPPTNDKTFVVIIANENYQKEVNVKYAINDGKVFKEYCVKTLGIPAKNIHLAQDASFGNMKSEIKWICDVSAAFNGQAKIIFYYAGHGMPNEADKCSYLLPVDGFSSDYETAIKLDDLYNRLNVSPSQSVTIFLDACFSGSIRDNGMLASARGVKIRPKADIVKGNMVVFSAATGDETAYPYKEKQHGLFTFYLLKKLQETNGNIDYLELSNYIIDNVKQQSIIVNQKSQTPQVNTSNEIQSTWQQMKFK